MHDLLELDAKRFFRDELREARADAFRNAEGFHTLVFAIERLGSALSGNVGSLGGRYRDVFTDLAQRSTLAYKIPGALPEWHTPFDALYEIVKEGRNDALHQGAYARLVTEHTVLLSLIFEDALMKEETLVRDFMVRGAVCAVPWQPISSVRQLMLTNSFSFLPIWATWQSPARWLVLSDYDLAKFLRGSASNAERNKRLVTTVRSAVQNDQLDVQDPVFCSPLDPISAVFEAKERRIVLVLERANPDHLVGVITPFDVL